LEATAAESELAAAGAAADPLAWERAFDSGPSDARIAAAEQIRVLAESAPLLPALLLLRTACIDQTDDAIEELGGEGAADCGLAMIVQGLAAMLAVSSNGSCPMIHYLYRRRPNA
jgi:hypothetical protein